MSELHRIPCARCGGPVNVGCEDDAPPPAGSLALHHTCSRAAHAAAYAAPSGHPPARYAVVGVLKLTGERRVLKTFATYKNAHCSAASVRHWDVRRRRRHVYESVVVEKMATTLTH